MLKQGDRVAYAAAFLKSTGQFTGPAGFRRGTYLGPDPHIKGYGRVLWDDAEAEIAAADQDDDWKADARNSGKLVALSNIAPVGSPRYALNDL